MVGRRKKSTRWNIPSALKPDFTLGFPSDGLRVVLVCYVETKRPNVRVFFFPNYDNARSGMS